MSFLKKLFRQSPEVTRRLNLGLLPAPSNSNRLRPRIGMKVQHPTLGKCVVQYVFPTGSVRVEYATGHYAGLSPEELETCTHI